MNGDCFDTFTRSIASAVSRRTLLRTSGGAILAQILVDAHVEPTGAALGKNGQLCRRGSQCASGLCKGAKGRKKCRQAPNQGICTIDQNVCSASGSISCGPGCSCYVTLDGRAFCGKNAVACGCGQDNACAQQGAGAVCVRQTTGCCTFAGNTTCAVPCADPD